MGIVKIAEEVHGDVTPAKVVLSWNVQRGVVILPKSSNPVRVKQNIELITLSDDHMQRIYNISKDPNRHQRLLWSMIKRLKLCSAGLGSSLAGRSLPMCLALKVHRRITLKIRFSLAENGPA